MENEDLDEGSEEATNLKKEADVAWSILEAVFGDQDG